MSSIEPADRADLESLAEINPVARPDGTWRDIIERSIDAGDCLVAREADGVAVAFLITDTSFFVRPFLRLLIVHPSYRRRGHATALIRHAEVIWSERVGRPDAHPLWGDVLFVSTNESHEIMRGLFERLGYEPSGRVENLDEGDPELFYMKRLR